MSHHRILLIGVGLFAVSMLLVGTSTTSSVTSTHNVDVTTTADHAAFLGFEQTTDPENGTTDLELTVTNQYSSETVFTAVTLTVDGTTVDATDGGVLGPGDSAIHRFESVACTETVTVTAVGQHVRVRIDRAVDCG